MSDFYILNFAAESWHVSFLSVATLNCALAPYLASSGESAQHQSITNDFSQSLKGTGIRRAPRTDGAVRSTTASL